MGCQTSLEDGSSNHHGIGETAVGTIKYPCLLSTPVWFVLGEPTYEQIMSFRKAFFKQR